MGQRWIPIFRCGEIPGKRNITPEEIKTVAANYNPATHEAPVVIGHPEENAPAYGWVEGLKAEGDTLFAAYRDIAPEFAALVNERRFPKRSAAFYQEEVSPLPGKLYLRHVGYLGALPPAVKGLADHKFAAGGGYIDYEFASDKLETQAGEKPPAANKEDFMPEGKEKEFQEKLTQAEADKKAAEAKFSEAQTKAQAAEQENAELKARLSKIETDNRRQELTAFSEELVKAGQLTPAMVKSGLVAFMETLPQDDASMLKFAEDKGKESPLAWFKGLLKSYPKFVEFGEKAPEHKDDLPSAGDRKTVGAERDAKARAYQEKHKCTYKEALLAVK